MSGPKLWAQELLSLLFKGPVSQNVYASWTMQKIFYEVPGLRVPGYMLDADLSHVMIGLSIEFSS